MPLLVAPISSFALLRLSLRVLFPKHSIGLRPRINPANGFILTMIAGDDRPLSKGRDPGLPLKDLSPHVSQMRFDGIQQGLELLGGQSLPRVASQFARGPATIFELVSLRFVHAGIQLRQGAKIVSAGVPARLLFRSIQIPQGLSSSRFAVVAATKIHIKNPGRY
jgi:hypothetical protein